MLHKIEPMLRQISKPFARACATATFHHIHSSLKFAQPLLSVLPNDLSVPTSEFCLHLSASNWLPIHYWTCMNIHSFSGKFRLLRKALESKKWQHIPKTSIVPSLRTRDRRKRVVLVMYETPCVLSLGMQILCGTVHCRIIIKTIQQINSRIKEAKVNEYWKILAEIQVCAMFHAGDIRRNVLLKFIRLCMETPCLCHFEGHKLI